MRLFFIEILFLDDTRLESTFLKNNLHDAITASGQMSRHNDEYKADIANLHGQISDLINAKVGF